MAGPVKASQAEVEQQKYQRGQWKTEEVQRVAFWDVGKFPPAWLTFEVSAALDELEEPYLEKKRTTVIKLAEGLSTGVPIRELLLLSETCTGSTWYGRPERGKTGWRDEPKIKAAYEAALKRAFWWKEQERGERISLRHRQLAETEDELVDMTQQALDTLRDLMEHAESEKVRMESATAILDRADEVTAVKGVQQHEHSLVQRAGPTMSAIRNRRRQRDGAVLPDDIPDDDVESLPPPPPGGDVALLPEPSGGNGDGDWEDVAGDEELGWVEADGEPVTEDEGEG